MEIVKYQISIIEDYNCGNGEMRVDFGTPFDTLKEAMEVALNTDFSKGNPLYLGTWIVAKVTFNDETFKTTSESVYIHCTADIERYKKLKRNVAEYREEIAELKSYLKADERSLKYLEGLMKKNNEVLEMIKED